MKVLVAAPLWLCGPANYRSFLFGLTDDFSGVQGVRSTANMLTAILLGMLIASDANNRMLCPCPPTSIAPTAHGKTGYTRPGASEAAIRRGVPQVSSRVSDAGGGVVATMSGPWQGPRVHAAAKQSRTGSLVPPQARTSLAAALVTRAQMPAAAAADAARRG